MDCELSSTECASIKERCGSITDNTVSHECETTTVCPAWGRVSSVDGSVHSISGQARHATVVIKPARATIVLHFVDRRRRLAIDLIKVYLSSAIGVCQEAHHECDLSAYQTSGRRPPPHATPSMTCARAPKARSHDTVSFRRVPERTHAAGSADKARVGVEFAPKFASHARRGQRRQLAHQGKDLPQLTKRQSPGGCAALHALRVGGAYHGLGRRESSHFQLQW